MKLKSAFFIALLPLGLFHPALHGDALVATVSTVKGTAYVTPSAGEAKQIVEGSTIAPGSSISTREGGIVGLKLLPGISTVVTPDTDIELVTLDYTKFASGEKVRTIRFELSKGKMISSLASLTKQVGKSDFKIYTPAGTAKAVGTADWAVSYEPSSGLLVETLDGAVQIILPAGQTVTIPGGQFATSQNGTTTVTGNMTSDQMSLLVSSIETAGFSPSGNLAGTGFDAPSLMGGAFGNDSQTSNPANISTQPVVSPNR